MPHPDQLAMQTLAHVLREKERGSACGRGREGRGTRTKTRTETHESEGGGERLKS